MRGIKGAREIFLGKSSESQAAVPTLSNLTNKALYLYYKIGAVYSLMKGLFSGCVHLGRNKSLALRQTSVMRDF